MSESFVISLKVALRFFSSFAFACFYFAPEVFGAFFSRSLKKKSGTSLMVLLMGNHKSTLCICIEAADGNPLKCVFSVVEFLKPCWFICETL